MYLPAIEVITSKKISYLNITKNSVSNALFAQLTRGHNYSILFTTGKNS